MLIPHLNQIVPLNQPRNPTLEEKLNIFIQVSMENHEKHDKRLDSLVALIKMWK